MKCPKCQRPTFGRHCGDYPNCTSAETPERILCAAIWVDDGEFHIHQPTKSGFVVCGYRHANIISSLHVLAPLQNAAMRRMSTQGFLTSKGRFVDRVEALEIAKAAGQLLRGTGGPGGQLYSEDLY